ncbi:MAG: hypothetical protein IPI20_05925 [Rhodoferax sp.]|nr:hypothetical protein [Rhodoferax sp.]
MNRPTPAIVAQGSVRRLPRAPLLLLAISYVLAGFIGREPWRNADITAFGFMAGLLQDGSDWFSPKLMGLSPEVDALLPYWLGAWAMRLAPSAIPPDLAARIPFGVMLGVAMLATWYATYYLARNPKAQPVAFAFGGEASPTDYARALADGGLLAFIACLGLAQLSHETTPALAQLCFTALCFFAFAALPYRTVLPLVAGTAGLAGLSLSGAPAMAVLFGIGGAVTYGADQWQVTEQPVVTRRRVAGIVVLTAGAALLATLLDLWHWRIELPDPSFTKWKSIGRLLLWFTWPAWPLICWTLWRWRRQLGSRNPSLHLSLPLWFVAVSLGTTIATASTDRSLLLALPALAALAAFSLPTLGRSVSALIDWFTLLFFSGCAFIIWVIWLAMQTGIPKQPAANVARLAPGFEHSFSFIPFVIALLATFAWIWLVKWRVGRHRAAIWKSLVLPAGGAVLSWLLLTTLWMPLLNYVRGDVPLVQRIAAIVKTPDCIEAYGLSRNRIAALQFHGSLMVRPAGAAPVCEWLFVERDALATLSTIVDIRQWQLDSTVRHPADRDGNLYLYRRKIVSQP